MSISVGTDILNPMLKAASDIASAKASIGQDGASVDATTTVLTGPAVTNTPAVAKKADDNKNMFLNLLVAQMKNQDPLSPMDNTQYVSQLAQFQALEATQNMQKSIESLGTQFKSSVDSQQMSAKSMTNATSVSLIGKEVRVKEANVSWSGQTGQKVAIDVNLGNNADATVQIVDSNGVVIKTLQTSGKNTDNSSSVEWDGSMDTGGVAPGGAYKINVVGQDKDPSLYAFAQDVVEGVRFTSNGVFLQIAGQELAASDVVNVAKDASSSMTGFDATSAGSAVGLLGKTVRIGVNSLSYKGLDGENEQFNVNAPAGSTVYAALVDKNGNAVRSMKGVANADGTATFDWNGQNDSGTFVDKGNYTIAVDGAKNNPSIYSYTSGTVSGVSNPNGLVELRVNGRNVLLSDIIDIAVASGSKSGV